MAFETMQQVCTEGPGIILGMSKPCPGCSPITFIQSLEIKNINNWIDQGSSNIEERASQRARKSSKAISQITSIPIEMRIRNEFPVGFKRTSQTIEPRVA